MEDRSNGERHETGGSPRTPRCAPPSTPPGARAAAATAGREDDFQTIFGYLRRHYGKVYINSARAEEITTSLALPARDAEAILAYRKAHGDFADLEAVKKVPEIDVKTLDEHKDAVAF